VAAALGRPARGIPGGAPDGIEGGIPGGIRDGVTGGIPGAVFVQSRGAWSEAVERAPESPARYENDKSAPVAITDAKVKTLSREEVQQARGWAPQGQASNYAVAMAVTVTNNSEARVSGLYFSISSDESDQIGHIIRPRVVLDPHASQTISANLDRRGVAPGSP